MDQFNRKPVVAGRFYPASKSALEKEVRGFLSCGVKPHKALCAIAPHAGYMYSGAVAGKVFASVEIPKTCYVLSPKHTGAGAEAAVWPSGSWSIPTGDVPVNEMAAAVLIESYSLFRADTMAHLGEHSLEVMIPFLLERRKDVEIVPIALGHLSLASINEIGIALSREIKKQGDAMIIVSTDMNHYESAKVTKEKDNLAIECVTALDAEGLIYTCAKNDITMCGVIPAATAIVACKELGAKKAVLVAHATSGDITGDDAEVVGYAGFVIE